MLLAKYQQNNPLILDKSIDWFYPSHLWSVYDPSGPIVATLYRKVPHMLHAKYQPNKPRGSGEEIV